MKIKIRPDDAGASGGSEWDAMSGWLAELREDDQGEPTTGGHTEPATGGHAETDSPGHTRTADQGHTGPGSQGHVQPASEGGSRTAAAAAAPQNGYASRTGPGSRVRTGPGTRAKGAAPAEAPRVRAVIGDELRIPITWCEMSPCISWHVDRAALGEADIRARAIRAGWRIDALGRMTCPQCQQTSVSFRATRPVVLWDRFTALAMAARATAAPGSRSTSSAAAPGSRSTGSAAGPNGRGTRRPASGHR